MLLEFFIWKGCIWVLYNIFFHLGCQEWHFKVFDTNLILWIPYFHWIPQVIAYIKVYFFISEVKFIIAYMHQE